MPNCRCQRVAPVIKTILVLCVGICRGSSRRHVSVNPIGITLSPQSASALSSIESHSAETARFQIDVFEWDQVPDGEMVLNPTQDLISYPKLLAIDPGDQRNIRVGTKDLAVATEKSYRIFVEELPPSDNGSRGNPIAHETGHSRIHSTYQAIGSTSGRTNEISADGSSFEIKNTGTVPFFRGKIRGFGMDARRDPVGSPTEPWHVLSGGVRKYSIEISPRECHQPHDLTVELEVEGKTFKQEFSVPTQVCHS